METLKLTYVGRYHVFHGDLFYMRNDEDHSATVAVDSVGETWVDIRRVPDGGWFPSERVEAFRALNGSAEAERELLKRGFHSKRIASFAHRVVERDGR